MSLSSKFSERTRLRTFQPYNYSSTTVINQVAVISDHAFVGLLKARTSFDINRLQRCQFHKNLCYTID